MDLKVESVTLVLLLLLATPILAQPKVPYEEWYNNRILYAISRFGESPEARARTNSMAYPNYLANKEAVWNSKCNVSHEAPAFSPSKANIGPVSLPGPVRLPGPVSLLGLVARPGPTASPVLYAQPTAFVEDTVTPENQSNEIPSTLNSTVDVVSASMSDIVQVTTEENIPVPMAERFSDSSEVDSDRKQWLFTEVEHTADGGMIIY